MSNWVRQKISLKYRLGEFVFFKARFSALVDKVHFTKMPADAIDPPGLAALLSDVDVLFVPSLPAASPLPRLSLIAGAIRYVTLQYDHYYVKVQGTFADYLKKFSSKTRATLNRKVRKFAEFSGGQIEWRSYRGSEDMVEFRRLARVVSEKTYQERLFSAGLPASEEYFEQMKRLAAENRVRAYVLFHKTEPIAYLYCPVEDGVLFYDFVGHDPAFSEWSPGTVLQYLVLEKLFEEGADAMFDFTEGAGPHKALFATDQMPCADVYYFKRNARNYLLVGFHAFLASLSRGITKTTEVLGVKRWLKKLIRSKA